MNDSILPQLLNLLKDNSQFDKNELRFNQECLAIYLKHALKNSHTKTFVLGGTEDHLSLEQRLDYLARCIPQIYSYNVFNTLLEYVYIPDRFNLAKTYLLTQSNSSKDLKHIPAMIQLVALDKRIELISFFIDKRKENAHKDTWKNLLLYLSKEDILKLKDQYISILSKQSINCFLNYLPLEEQKKIQIEYNQCHSQYADYPKRFFSKQDDPKSPEHLISSEPPPPCDC